MATTKIWHGTKLAKLAEFSEEDAKRCNYRFDECTFDFIEAKKIIDSGNYRDFFYDRATSAIMFNITAHPVYIGYVEMFYRECVDKKGSFDDFFMAHPNDIIKYSEYYLEKGRGFYMSSVSDKITIGEGVKLTAQEKILFKGFEFRKL